jgi:hypothetical protein
MDREVPPSVLAEIARVSLVRGTEFNRSAAVFQRPPDPARPPKVMVDGWDQTVFGCSLREYLNAAFLLHVGALRNSGMFDLTWLDPPQFAEVRQHLPSALMHELFARHFVADRHRLIATQRAVEEKGGRPDPAYRRFGFNPLTKYPVVSGLGDHWYMPVPHLLVRKASSIGVFFAGMECSGLRSLTISGAVRGRHR